MSLSTIYSRAKLGIQAPLVQVETHLSGGLPKFSIVGLPEAAVKESRDRVRSTLINLNFDFPMLRITVNLFPADLPKEGGRFDLPIALGILAASRQIPTLELEDYELVPGGMYMIPQDIVQEIRRRDKGVFREYKQWTQLAYPRDPYNQWATFWRHFRTLFTNWYR